MFTFVSIIAAIIDGAPYGGLSCMFSTSGSLSAVRLDFGTKIVCRDLVSGAADIWFA